MLGVCPERRKGSEIIGFVGHASAALSCSLLFRGTSGNPIIGFVGHASAALSCSLLFRGTSGNPADALDASKMTVLSSRLDHVTPRGTLRVLPSKRSGLFA